MTLIQGTGNRYVQYSQGKSEEAIPTKHKASEEIEGWEPEAIYDVQQRIAGWLVEFGYEAGRLTQDEFDDLQVIFAACGLPKRAVPRVIGTTPREGEYTSLTDKPVAKRAGRTSIKAPTSEENKRRARHKAHATCDGCGTCACNPDVKQVTHGLCPTCTDKGLLEKLHKSSP
jgi:hypothetical protein